MTLKIDTPCLVRIRPGSQDREASVSLDVLGGSLWFPRSACPSSLFEGPHKGADVEVRMSNVHIGQNVRTVFLPSRLVSVS